MLRQCCCLRHTKSIHQMMSVCVCPQHVQQEKETHALILFLNHSEMSAWGSDEGGGGGGHSATLFPDDILPLLSYTFLFHTCTKVSK